MKIDRLWLSLFFRDRFSDKELSIEKETEKAYLLKDKKHESWVPKSAISKYNSKLVSNKEIDRKRGILTNSIKMPLLHARTNSYNHLLKLPLMQHQKDVIKTLENKSKVYLGIEQGLGKTPVSLARIKLMNNGLQTLIICEKSLMQQWWSEIDKFAPEMRDSISIINYDMIFRESKKDFMASFKKNKFNLILEEVSCLGNENSKRSKKCIELAKRAKTVQLLSGSFFGGHFEKTYACTLMMGFTWTRQQFDDLFVITVPSVTHIRTRWGTKDKIDKLVVGYKNIDNLIKAMYGKGAVFVRAEECIDLPDFNESIINVSQTEKARKIEKRLFSHLEYMDNDARNGAFSQLKLAESLGENEDKVKIVYDMIANSDCRWIVFYQFDSERDVLLSICKKLGRSVSEISGHVKDQTNYDNDDKSVTIVNYKSGSRGKNFQKANKMIFTSPLDADAQMQAEKRIRRIGQKKKCFYYMLVSNGRFEKSKLRDIKKRRDYVNKIG